MKGVDKMSNASLTNQPTVPPCCPKLEPDPVCDVLDFQYRQLYHPRVGDRTVTVEAGLQHYTTSGRKSPLVHDRSPNALHLRQRHQSQLPQRTDFRRTLCHVRIGRLHVRSHRKRLWSFHEHFQRTL